MTFYEFFAGGGMARLGLGSKWRCAFANEWDAKKAAAYTRHFGARGLRVCDVASLTTADLPGEADLAWASFPCQDLSLAGKGAGLAGKRSGAFHAFWNLIEALAREGRAPRLIALENVVGTITSHQGRDFEQILRRMAETGYAIGPLVLDAADFLPQSRPRLFVVGTRMEPPNQGSPGFGHTESLLAAYDRLPSELRDRWIWWRLRKPPERRAALIHLIERDAEAGNAARLLALMSPTNLDKVAFAQSRRSLVIGTVYRRTRDGVQRAEVRFDGVAGCLRTPAGGSSRQTVLLVQGDSVRARLMTARELARLMGVPEDYEIPAGYNEAYHLFGDGLVVPVVRYLANQVLTPAAGGGDDRLAIVKHGEGSRSLRPERLDGAERVVAGDD